MLLLSFGNIRKIMSGQNFRKPDIKSSDEKKIHPKGKSGSLSFFCGFEALNISIALTFLINELNAPKCRNDGILLIIYEI